LAAVGVGIGFVWQNEQDPIEAHFFDQLAKGRAKLIEWKQNAAGICLASQREKQMHEIRWQMGQMPKCLISNLVV
jgi:hypothetical protein